MRRIHAIITGNVQGVSFRSLTRKKAKELDISGWVQKLPNGSVEVVAEGSESRIEDFSNFLRRGPQGATVMGCRIKEQEFKAEFNRFNRKN